MKRSNYRTAPIQNVPIPLSFETLFSGMSFRTLLPLKTVVVSCALLFTQLLSVSTYGQTSDPTPYCRPTNASQTTATCTSYYIGIGAVRIKNSGGTILLSNNTDCTIQSDRLTIRTIVYCTSYSFSGCVIYLGSSATLGNDYFLY